MISLRNIAAIVCLAFLMQLGLACPYDFGNYPHFVNIRVINASTGDYGFKWYNPIPNATITATEIQTEAPDWFWSILGAKTKETTIDLTERNGTTDKNGVATFQLYDAMLYNVTVVCDNGKVSTFKLYPHESEYNIYVNC